MKEYQLAIAKIQTLHKENKQLQSSVTNSKVLQSKSPLSTEGQYRILDSNIEFHHTLGSKCNSFQKAGNLVNCEQMYNSQEKITSKAAIPYHYKKVLDYNTSYNLY